MTFQLDTIINLVAAWSLGGTQLTEICMRPFGQTQYTCSIVALLTVR